MLGDLFALDYSQGTNLFIYLPPSVASGSPFIWPPYPFDTLQLLWDYLRIQTNLLHFPYCCCKVLQDTISHRSYGVLDPFMKMNNWKAVSEN